MDKFKKIVLFVLIIATLLIILKQMQVLSIFTPKAPPEITDYVNKYYFPLNTRSTNSDKCTPQSITIGSSFPWDTAKLPVGTDYVFYNSSYYKVSRSGATRKGTCTQFEGNQILVNNQAPLKNFLFIERKDGKLVICQNLDGEKYKYAELTKQKVTESNNRFYIKYSIPQIEPEGKYYCDTKSKTIYRTPCGGKTKEVVEVCELGCGTETLSIDTGQVQAVKCIGEFKPNKQVCSGDGKKLYTTDPNGKLTTADCCSCTDGKCSKTVGCGPKPEGCKLLSGDGKNPINVFIVDYVNNKNHSDWIINFLPTQVPYNEFTFNFYSENNKYDCRGKIAETSKDVRIDYRTACPSAKACAMYTRSTREAGWMSYTVPGYAGVTKSFLLLHELGHVYLHFGHTCDNSIMDADGGHSNRYAYQPYQVELVRKNLNESKLYNPPKGFGGC